MKRNFDDGIYVREVKLLFWLDEVIFKRTVKGSKRKKKRITGTEEEGVKKKSSADKDGEFYRIKFETVKGWVAVIISFYHEQIFFSFFFSPVIY